MSDSVRQLMRVVVVLALSVGAVLLAQRVLFPPGGGYLVNAEFADTGGLTKNSDVKIGGVPGGRVKELKLSKRDTALVTIELEKGAYPIGEGAEARSRPVNLLGEKFIELDPGDMKKPVKSGSSIPITRTSRPTELDDVLNVLAPDVRARLRILINEAGITMGGRGKDFSMMLRQIPATLEDTKQLVNQFRQDKAALRDVLTRSNRVLTAFNSERNDLQSLVDEASGALKTTAINRRNLADTFRTAPAALRQLRSTTAELGRTGQELGPFADNVVTAAPSLTATLKGLPGFADDAEPALEEVSKRSPALARLGREARPTVRRLRPTARELKRFSRRADPVVKIADDGAFSELLRLMNGWSRTISRTDGLSHMFGLRIIFDDELLTNALDRYIKPASGGNNRRRPKPDRGAPATESPKQPRPEQPNRPSRPSLPDLVEGAGRNVDELLEGLKGGTERELDRVGELLDDTLKGRNALEELKRRSQAQDSRGETGRLLDYLVGP